MSMRCCRGRKSETTASDDADSKAAGIRLRALRLMCLLEILYATGLRVSELVSLPATAARRDARMIVVRGKGDKERMVPLNDAAKTAMSGLSRRAQGGEPRPAAGRSRNGCFRPSAIPAI